MSLFPRDQGFMVQVPPVSGPLTSNLVWLSDHFHRLVGQLEWRRADPDRRSRRRRHRIRREAARPSRDTHSRSARSDTARAGLVAQDAIEDLDDRPDVDRQPGFLDGSRWRRPPRAFRRLRSRRPAGSTAPPAARIAVSRARHPAPSSASPSPVPAHPLARPESRRRRQRSGARVFAVRSLTHRITDADLTRSVSKQACV